MKANEYETGDALVARRRAVRRHLDQRAAAQDRGNVRRGLLVAREVCAECHVVEKTRAASPNPLAPSVQTIASAPGMTELALYAALRTPHGTMPLVLPDMADVENVFAYIRSLRSDE